MTMHILLNGQTHSLDKPISAMELLSQLGLGEKRLALEVNGEIVSRSNYVNHLLNDGDKIEIVHAVGGG